MYHTNGVLHISDQRNCYLRMLLQVRSSASERRWEPIRLRLNCSIADDAFKSLPVSRFLGWLWKSPSSQLDSYDQVIPNLDNPWWAGWILRELGTGEEYEYYMIVSLKWAGCQWEILFRCLWVLSRTLSRLTRLWLLDGVASTDAIPPPLPVTHLTPHASHSGLELTTIRSAADQMRDGNMVFKQHVSRKGGKIVLIIRVIRRSRLSMRLSCLLATLPIFGRVTTLRYW